MKNSLLSTIAVTAAALSFASAQQQTATPSSAVNVTDAMLRSPSPNDWIEWRGDRGASGYSPLDRITATNVGKLRIAYTVPLEGGSQEPEPLVANGVMYLPQ